MKTITAIAAVALASLLSLFTAPALSQSYPTKPIRFLVGFAPGGTNDIVARMLAQKLTDGMGQPVIVENRPGANTAIATELVARAAPNGYTILLNAPGRATNAAFVQNEIIKWGEGYSLRGDQGRMKAWRTLEYALTLITLVPASPA
jgi:tripartite-type tricarboxylate transporter receptor subunit TctC